MNATAKTLIFWAVILISALLLWQVVRANGPRVQPPPEISYSQFLSQVDAGNVSQVRISKNRADGKYRDGSPFQVIVPASQEQMLQTLREKSVEVWYAEQNEPIANWIVNLAPLALLAALWFFMIRQMKYRSNNQAPGTSNASWPSH